MFKYVYFILTSNTNRSIVVIINNPPKNSESLIASNVVVLYVTRNISDSYVNEKSMRDRLNNAPHSKDYYTYDKYNTKSTIVTNGSLVNP